MACDKGFGCVAWFLVLLAGINLGLVGVFGFDAVGYVFSLIPGVEGMGVRIFNVIVGVSAAYLGFHCAKSCKTKK